MRALYLSFLSLALLPGCKPGTEQATTGAGSDVASAPPDGLFTVEIKNEHIVKTSEHGHGLIHAFTAGCFIGSPSLGSIKPSKVSTVAGMAQLALDGELYFNLHTTGHTYFGDIRGQIQGKQP